ncbi:MAG: hypothetical protein IK016_08030 [Lachnospiraceae bacterium]|nr:hypothetical protein [Lachnospiraceae bacterium]
MADTEKTIKEMMQQAKDKAEPALKKAKEKAEPALKKAKEKAEPALKKAKEKAEPTIKKAREKAEPALKKAKEKAEPAIRETLDKTAKAMAKTEVFLQFDDNELRIDDIVEKARTDYADKGGNPRSIKTLRVYVKPQDRAAYYVVNHDETGRVFL